MAPADYIIEDNVGEKAVPETKPVIYQPEFYEI